MQNPFRTIAISLVPTINFKEFLYCFISLFNVRALSFDSHRKQLIESKIASFIGDDKHCFITDNGRTALMLSLKALGINSQDEVIIQAFTCVALPLAISETGAKIKYVDINNDFNIDIVDLKNKITLETKAIIIQHTFGRPDNITLIKEICTENSICLIEDCAHSFGNAIKSQRLGSFGDVSIVSFGRDKTITGLTGGCVITSNIDWMNKITQISSKLPLRSKLYNWRLIFTIVVDYIVLNLYNLLNLGKFLHQIFKLTKFEIKVLSNKEKLNIGTWYQGMSLASLMILEMQFNRIGLIQDQRQRVNQYYNNLLGIKKTDSTLLNTSILVKNPELLRTKAREQNIFLGNWYDSPVAPKSVDLELFGYVVGSCPNAEKICKSVVNLPNLYWMNEHDVVKIVNLVNKYGN